MSAMENERLKAELERANARIAELKALLKRHAPQVDLGPSIMHQPTSRQKAHSWW